MTSVNKYQFGDRVEFIDDMKGEIKGIVIDSHEYEEWFSLLV